jgi:hypothetical protein
VGVIPAHDRAFERARRLYRQSTLANPFISEEAMFDRIRRSLVLASSLAVAGVVVAPQLTEAFQSPDRAARAEHAVAGELKKIDRATQTVVVHTADGVDETFKFSERTVVRGAKAVTRATDDTAKALLEGGAVVLHYIGEGADRTAVGLNHLGKRTLRIAKGTVVRVDSAGKFVVVKTAAGADETFELTKDAVVDSGRGIDHAAHAAGGAIKQGAELIVHYSDEGGKKVAHLIRQL